jgi:mRNA-degrading endonuclease RelE of RelBE toxin-antitoxin system
LIALRDLNFAPANNLILKHSLISEATTLSYRIAFSRISLSHLQAFTAREQKIIRDALAEQLSYEPNVPTRNRKEMRPNLLAVGELRIGDFRVYYDVDEEESIVDIRAIGIKEGNQVRIGGEIVEL